MDLIKHLTLLEQRNGGKLTPQAVVEEAESPESPLHSYFEWDDTEAARQHRLHQARHLIARVKLTYSAGDRAIGPMRAFVSIQDGRRRCYKSLAVVMSDDDARGEMLRRARTELEGFRARYAMLEELATIMSAIEHQLGKTA